MRVKARSFDLDPYWWSTAIKNQNVECESTLLWPLRNQPIPAAIHSLRLPMRQEPNKILRKSLFLPWEIPSRRPWRRRSNGNGPKAIPTLPARQISRGLKAILARQTAFNIIGPNTLSPWMFKWPLWSIHRSDQEMSSMQVVVFRNTISPRNPDRVVRRLWIFNFRFCEVTGFSILVEDVVLGLFSLLM